MRQIEVHWSELDITVTADLDPRNAGLCDAVWNALPYRSLQGHALVSGQYLYHVAPIPDLLHVPGPCTADRRFEPDGMLYCTRLQHVGIKYGEVTEPLPMLPLARIQPKDLDALRNAGREIWNAVYSTKQVITAEVRRAGEDSGHRLPRLHATAHPVDALIGDIHSETERIWLTPPRELVELHQGLIPSRAGSYGTALTTMLFVNGETRPLGYSCYGGLVRAAAGGMPLDVLRQMTEMMAVIPAQFLGYCGLEKLWEFTERIIGCLDGIHELEDFTALMSQIALYINCLGSWNLQLFPWEAGDHLRRTT
ncbi:hypothetical protein [Streptomyces sp. NPDC002952]|uniref:cucumopine synthase-related protein n=1 Tax=Streptomyces sp. NPDC002952 TaxID=3364673 RepID=UPI0036BE4741